ncbi:hypothetical protein [Paenisporosarcina cavernae]|uniref:Uncharacterized protein n=1 Tax=Paenisporosarcina cavernae TaxID=2320858 RepID=A0A385YVC7_9BACL|nr:hypothetical protein [Paenisporosarcina cavernae]AYC29453.1 hypothetical protein D3873_05980 [Paenisporosarcina cavernae]
MSNFDTCKNAYQKIYSSRRAAQQVACMAELIKLVEAELRDELSHPRVRKSPVEKLEEAKYRIRKTALTNEESTSILQLYEEVFGSVNTN